MPNPPEGWAWWIFSVIIAGIPIAIGANLLSNWAQKFLDNRSEQRRAMRLAEDEAAQKFVEAMLKQIEEDKSLLVVMAHNAAKYESMASQVVGMSLSVIIVVTVVVYTSFNGFPSEIQRGLLIAGSVAIVMCVSSMLTGWKIRERREIYDTVISLYWKRHEFPVAPPMLD